MKKVVILSLALIFLGSVVGVVKIHDRLNKEQPTIAPVYIEIDPNIKSLHWLSSFFQKYNTSNADELAVALLLAPPDFREVLAAIVVKESNGNPNALGKAGERGLFQVRERYWGKVPKGITAQVLQASYIYATLYGRHGSEYRAVKAYNGSGYKAEKYAYAVLEMKGE